MTPAETDRINEFIEDRTSRVRGNDRPNDVQIRDRVVLLTYVVPTTFSGHDILNRTQMTGFDWFVPQRAIIDPCPSMYNVQGYITNSSRCSLLLFYAGAVESLLTFLVESLNPVPRFDSTGFEKRLAMAGSANVLDRVRCIDGTALETDVLKMLKMSVNALRKCGIKSPLAVHLDLRPLKGIGVVTNSLDCEQTIEGDYLELSEELPEYESQDVAQFLRPAFDKLWQASGWPGSPSPAAK